MDFWIKALYINALKLQPNLQYLRCFYRNGKSPLILNARYKPQADSIQRLIYKIHGIAAAKHE